mgnify:CR=1 FL=1
MKDRGFTLLELIITMGVMAFLIEVGVLSYTAVGRAMTSQVDELDSSWQTYRALSDIETDLREARLMITAGPASMSFWWKDLDGDTLVNPLTEVLTYSWDGTAGGDIVVSGARSRVVARGIQNFALTYDSVVPATVKSATAQLTLQAGKKQTTGEMTIMMRNK